jgi:hopanoid biosynthesis associated protein HpnK
LIVNADDFGLTAGVNRAIVEAHQRGVVTSATLMANSAEFDGAARLAGGNPRLSIGCHIVLVDGSPLLDPKQAPSLVARNSDRFRQSLGQFAVRSITGSIQERDIEAEAVAQIRKVQSAGVAVSHVDTHKHTHVLPKVLEPLLRAARTCGVRAMRNPFGPLPFSFLTKNLKLWKQYVRVKSVAPLAGNFRKVAKRAGLAAPDGTIGIAHTGYMTAELLLHTLRELPDGTWELVCHPGYNDSDLNGVRTRLRESRAQELAILTSAEIRKTLEQGGIELISYAALG